MGDRIICLKVNVNDYVFQMKERILRENKIRDRGYKLRHATHDFLDENQQIGYYQFLNGTSLEFGGMKKMKLAS